MSGFQSSPALQALGWTPFFHQQWLGVVSEKPEFSELRPARVCSVERGELVLADGERQKRAVLCGRLEGSLTERELPCVGDFVLALPTAAEQLSRVEHVFERSSLFERKSAGGTARCQAIAANVDLAIIVCTLPPLDADPHALRHGVSPRRIERYLHAVASAPARAVVALSKADLRPDADVLSAALSRELEGAEVIVVSAHSGAGIARLSAEIAENGSAVLVGSSGVGKSSLMNRLLGKEVQRTAEVRAADTRGRHTTTRRELYCLASGGVLIDTPGMREFALAGADAPLHGFGEIDALAGACRFRDCRHQAEPGCAVRAALSRGEVSEERLEHQHRLERELAFQRTREAARERRQNRRHARGTTSSNRGRERNNEHD